MDEHMAQRREETCMTLSSYRIQSSCMGRKMDALLCCHHTTIRDRHGGQWLSRRGPLLLNGLDHILTGQHLAKDHVSAI